MIDISSLSEDELDKLMTSVKEEKSKRTGFDKLNGMFHNKDFLRKFLSSDAFVSFCKKNGYDLHSDDIVNTVLPEYLRVMSSKDGDS